MAENRRSYAWPEAGVPRLPRPLLPQQVPEVQLQVAEVSTIEEENTREDNSIEELEFRGDTHADIILDGLNKLRKENTFTDVRIKVEEQEFPAHRCVLSSFSPYFRAMFTAGLAESDMEVVPLQGVEPDMIRNLLEFAYTGSISITKHNVQNLLSAANLLEVLEVRDACCQFLDRNMDETNCLGIHCFAEVHACTELMHRAKAFLLQHFQDIVDGDEFNTISESKLVEIISSDQLVVDKEETVFYACLSWLQAQERVPKCFYNILEHVRLPLLSPYFIHDVVERTAAVTESAECRRLVDEAKTFHLLPDRRDSGGERTRPRMSAGTTQVIVAVGGEDDKVVMRSVEFWDIVTGAWKTLACLPFAVSKHGLVVSGHGKLYMAGGEYPDGSASRAMWRYDPVLNAWHEMAGMNVCRSELGLVMLDGCVYAVGGWEGRSRLDSVERYDPETNSWQFIPPLKMAVTSPAVVAYDGALYVTGGAILEDGDGIELVQRYDNKTGYWTEMASMLIPRSGSAACVLGGYIYVVGGWHASTENTNKVERYDVARNKWEFVGCMCERRYRPAAAAVGGRMYVLGGEEGLDRHHDTIEVYDPDSDTWSISGYLTSSRSWLSAATLSIRKDMGRERMPCS
ncbi:kelch-like protein 12 isoform X2 [Eurytemora carolleeae]|uniref:kelch-like protein 12 isoform X1 n=1 Tax=Eurytemora carolleeae TaxID=1294199 RepID=UPI000C77F598|nr:kelch-like protein 12 isoform X1 [Eurytemora carolleeae]XP_023329220.1 kelch-like protein 12 isoform X2 [Eurytemora carolleeae]|eukprot:XP_023329218.1 kelch-like protein 12 isoform X1 [Eurytemora affinis]